MTNKTKQTPTPGCSCADTVRIEGACPLHQAAPDLLYWLKGLYGDGFIRKSLPEEYRARIASAIARAEGGS